MSAGPQNVQLSSSAWLVPGSKRRHPLSNIFRFSKVYSICMLYMYILYIYIHIYICISVCISNIGIDSVYRLILPVLSLLGGRPPWPKSPPAGDRGSVESRQRARTCWGLGRPDHFRSTYTHIIITCLCICVLI